MDRIEGLFAAMRMAGQHVEWQGRDGIATFAQDVSQALCRYFNCTHASLWLLEGDPGEQRLQCLGAHELEGDSAQNPVCDQQVFPGYFQALLGEGVFRCVDATTDARLHGLPAPTWRAMLDVCGQINGKTVGVIALGQRGEAREWTKREELDLRRAAAKTCLRLHALRQELETV